MRLAITHETVFRFEKPASRAIQTLRLTPRNTESQLVHEWRIDVSQDCHLPTVEDAFGNLTHTFSIDGPMDELSIVATGSVVTEDTAGVIHTTRERLPLGVWCRATDATPIEPSVRAFADAAFEESAHARLAALHLMMGRLHERVAVDPDAPAALPHVALETGMATPADLAHLFIAAARARTIPARFVSGWVFDPDRAVAAAPRVWIEAHLGPALGWVGFDAVDNCCPTDRWVRCAVGLDELGAAPIRGVRSTFAAESVATRITVREISAA